MYCDRNEMKMNSNCCYERGKTETRVKRNQEQPDNRCTLLSDPVNVIAGRSMFFI